MKTTSEVKKVLGSFRDPSGFLFFLKDSLYRQINIEYKENYDFLISSGLYKNLIDSKLLIHHEEVDINAKSKNAYKIIKPKIVPFISYPYEWCFSQLKDAALTTLEIQKKALDHGMTIKDCSSYNIQFINGKAIFIDTLSFEKYQNGDPWAAYKQFCQHFLAPLVLMSYSDIRLNQLTKIFIDGVPLDLASSLLPLRSKLRLGILTHINVHAKSQKYYSDKEIKTERVKGKVSLNSLKGLIDNLESTIKKLNWNPSGTEWADYYDDTNYISEAINHKKELVSNFLDEIKPNTVWDLGANTGMFSHISSNKGIFTISFDIDPACVERNYLNSITKKKDNIFPLLIDLTNPSPSIGWENKERDSLLDRGPADMVFALALIHHLAISNNVPLDKLAKFFSGLCKSLIIEFVPKTDSQVKKLLTSRDDIFINYDQNNFEDEFNKFFKIRSSEKIKDSERTLYLMEKRNLN